VTGGLPARLSAFLGSLATTAASSVPGRIVAVGWATVELDRAMAELGVALGLPSGRFTDADPSVSLGARCLVAADGFQEGVSLVLLEPNTEGRLAATLARNDEGPAATWLAVERLGQAAEILRESGTNLAHQETGPFGPERLILDGPIHGPHRLLIERPGTIRP
jgi:hypothetical protein